jgi:hypothetical protein
VQNRGQNRTREIRPSGIVEGLQETWPVGAFSTRRARLISISTDGNTASNAGQQECLSMPALLAFYTVGNYGGGVAGLAGCASRRVARR